MRAALIRHNPRSLQRRSKQPGNDSPAYSIFHQPVSGNSIFARIRRQSPEIPVRVCPHCGHPVRTWVKGEISCIRCENDIGRGDETKSLTEVSREMGLSME